MLTILRNNGNLDKEDPQQINFFFKEAQIWIQTDVKASDGNVKTENQPKNPVEM